MSFRRTAYNIFFRLSPLVIVILLELALRFLGVGNSYVLFKESEDSTRYEINKYHYRRYLCEREFEDLDVLYQDFPKDKEPDTYRVFLISDHTLMAAYPETMQEELLADFTTEEGKHVDVIQISVPYTNSFAVKRIAASISKYEADACIVFTGQNEFYGLPNKSAWMRDIGNYWGINNYTKMKNHRFIQILDRFLYLKKPIQETFPPSTPDDWIVETDSTDYREIASYFTRNLKDIDKKIKCPVFYVNLPVNIKQQPYRSFFDDKELLDENFAKECSSLLKSADNYSTTRWLDDLNAWEPETAIYYYCKAMIEERNNNLDLAVKNYWKAVKLDAFKVRPDQNFKTMLLEAGQIAPNKIIDLEAYLCPKDQNSLTCQNYFMNGLELNEDSKLALVKLIKNDISAYFSDEKK